MKKAKIWFPVKSVPLKCYIWTVLLPLSLKSEGKGKGLDTCYSIAYMSQTRDQQRFTISEVAADWHEPMVPQCILWPSITHATDNWTHGVASRHTIAPLSLLGLHPVAIATTHFRPTEGRRLSWPEQLATCSRLLAVDRVWVEPATSRLRVWYSTTRPVNVCIHYTVYC